MSIAELIIGMSLVILFIGIIFPRIDSGYMKAEWERRRICSEIRYLKRRDLAGLDEFMWFTKSNGKTYYKTLFRGKVLRQREIDKDIDIRTVLSKVKFQESGVPNESGEINVVYKNKYYRITITPISGRILFKEGFYSDDK